MTDLDIRTRPRQHLPRRIVWICRTILASLLSATVSIAAQPEEVTFPGEKLVLHGFIYRPQGTGPHPGVLWNHGSERRPGWLPQLGQLFTSKGYVLFVPHRRGHGRSPGEYILDLLDRERRARGAGARSRLLVELMDTHLEAQTAGLAYLKRLPYVEPQRIAVAGCSFGGIQTVLITERDFGLRAAIDFAGGAQTWAGSPELRERMLRAVRYATVPLLFIQAENDYDLSPSRALARELERVGKQHKLVIFPPFGKTAQEGHAFCVRGEGIWGPEVFSFLSATMGR